MKITQASVLGLLGVGVVSAVASKRRPDMANYPKYDTVIAPTSAQLADQAATKGMKVDFEGTTFVTSSTSGSDVLADVNVILKSIYYDKQPYACYRSGRYYFPTQNIAIGSVTWNSSINSGNGDPQDVADALATQTTGRSFWQLTQTHLGTLASDDFENDGTTDNRINQWLSAIPAGYDTTVTSAASANTSATSISKDAAYANAFGSTAASGNVWACCEHVHNQMSCNGGIDTQMLSGISKIANYRLVMKSGLTASAGRFGQTFTSGTNDPEKGTFTAANSLNTNKISDSLNDSQQLLTFNNDILLSTMYQHSSSTAMTSTKRSPAAAPAAVAALPNTTNNALVYCDMIHHEFATVNSSAVTAVTSNGFNGSSKCTYQVTTAKGDSAPTMKIMKADYREFLVHYIEWMNTSALSTTFFLPNTADASAFKLGTYADLMYSLNPITPDTAVTTWLSGVTAPSTDNVQLKMHSQLDPATWLPGSIGNVVWVPGKSGQLKKHTFTTFDAGLVKEMYAIQEAQNTSFEAAKTAYEPKRTAYNDAVAKETTRLADAAMDPPIEIPERPCAPQAPSGYMGPQFMNPSSINTFEAVLGAGAVSSVNTYLEANTATAADDLPGYTVNPFFKFDQYAAAGAMASTIPNIDQSNKMGWLQAAEDIDVLESYTNELGHVFGRFGQGQEANSMKPFAWLPAVVDTDKPALQISMFPEAIHDTVISPATGEGLALDTKFIEIEFAPKAFATLADYLKPATPTAAVAPGPGVSAVYLAATSTAAVALALATLY